MHSCLIRVGRKARLILVIASLLASITFTGCGSRSVQSAAGPAVTIPSAAVLPPAIAAAEPVLLFNGTGTTSSDVAAVEAVLDTLGVGYVTADSTELNAMTEPQLGGYKLMIVPGGNSITIGQSLTADTASMIRGAVQEYGVHYLGLCAGAFFGGYSVYNGVDLTGGVSFDFYADEFKGIHLRSEEHTSELQSRP